MASYNETSKTKLEDLAKDFELSITEEQTDQLHLFKNVFISANKKINLSSIASEDIDVLHFIDSLLVMKVVDFRVINKVIDVGTGGGFPGIPLAICNADTQFTLVDSVKKKTDFLSYAISKLKLKNCTAIHSRAEDLYEDDIHKSSYDIATARAVTELSGLYDLLAPFIKDNGQLIALKGPQVEDEISEKFQSSDIVLQKFILPRKKTGIEDIERVIVQIKKLSS